MVSINSTSEEVRSGVYPRNFRNRGMVSINSTSEEVRSLKVYQRRKKNWSGFPLIQLPRKSEVFDKLNEAEQELAFPLIQLPRKSEAKN